MGAFFTAGIGPIPNQVFVDLSMPFEDVEESICQLPVVSRTKLLVSLKRPDDYLELAERGLFVYDWSDIHKTIQRSRNMYEKMAIPLSPIHANVLPDLLARMVANITFNDVDFSTEEFVNVLEKFECTQGGFKRMNL